MPGTDHQARYILEAGMLDRIKAVIPVVEVHIPTEMYLDAVRYRQEIINLRDDQVNSYNRYPGVKFGSRRRKQ
ncbi:MAG: hypothetical protein ACLS37_12140 [Alistipes sp.]